MGPAYFTSPVEAWICRHTRIILHLLKIWVITSNLWQEGLKEILGVSTRRINYSGNKVRAIRCMFNLWPVGDIWCALQEPWWLWWTRQTTSQQQTAVDTCRRQENGADILSEIDHRASDRINPNCRHPWQSNDLRKDIIGSSLLQFLSQPKPKETDSKHGCDSDYGGCHSFIESFNTL